MTNIDAVNALISAINADRFAEIEAIHNPDVTFWSFQGPTLHDSVSVQDWHVQFLREYADCNYTDLEYIEDGDSVAVRATIEAKGYDWRPFAQRVVEVFRMQDGGVAERRMYSMLRDVELDKAATASMTNATGFRGGSVSATKTAVEGFYGNLLSGALETATTFLDEKASIVDSVCGITSGPANVVDLMNKAPVPAFGAWRVTRSYIGAKDALVELAIDPNRPRRADWVRLVEGKIAVVESYWMLREIGVSIQTGERHLRKVIMPI